MIRRLIILGFISAWLSSDALAQTAREWAIKAQQQYQSGEYEESADSYDACIKAGAVRATTYYNAACSSALAGRTDAAFRWIGEAIERGYRDLGHLKKDTDLKSLHADERWKGVIDQCKEQIAEFESSIKEPLLRRELLEMKRVDQEFRNNLMAMHKENPDQPIRMDEHGDVDARNTARLKEIIARHGWPTKSLVGEDGAQAAWLLAQHADADPSFQRQCLDLMKAAPKGEVSSVNLAYLVDRVLVAAGKPQLYGTQFWMHEGELQPRPIEDEVNLDKRRREAGMGPMSAYRMQMTGKR